MFKHSKFFFNTNMLRIKGQGQDDFYHPALLTKDKTLQSIFA